MRKPLRIGFDLFDDDLKTLINASAKIFPMSQDDISSNLNPNGYEFAKVGRQIYMWKDGIWDYIVADDIDIKWGDIQNRPTEYTPATHTHTESDVPGIDKYTKQEADLLLNAKAEKDHTHGEIADIGEEITGINAYIDSLIERIDGKAPLQHNHDGAYYTKSEIESKLLGKASATHKHTKADINDFTHNHNKAEISDFPDVYTKIEIDNMMIESGAGDMLKSTYDKNNDGVVDKAEAANSVPWAGVTGKPSTFPPDTHTHTELHSHSNKNTLDAITASFTSELLDKLNKIAPEANKYTHPTGDGNLHIPATGTTNNGKVLKAGNTAGSVGWGEITPESIGAAELLHVHTKTQITDFPAIPKNTSDLTNDSGFTKITLSPDKPTDGTGFWLKEV